MAFEASYPGTPLAVRTQAVMHAYADAQGELRAFAAIQDGELTIVIGDSRAATTRTRRSTSRAGSNARPDLDA